MDKSNMKSNNLDCIMLEGLEVLEQKLEYLKC